MVTPQAGNDAQAAADEGLGSNARSQAGSDADVGAGLSVGSDSGSGTRSGSTSKAQVGSSPASANSKNSLSGKDLAILTAPLLMGQTTWGSREVAEFAGVSQSAVARVWQTAFARKQLPQDLPPALSIIGAWISNQGAFIAFRPETGAKTAGSMRSAHRVAIQTLLAGALLHSGTGASQPFTFEPGTFVVGTDPAFKPAFPERVTYIYIEPHEWQNLLPHLLDCAHRTPAGDLRHLHHELLLWATHPEREFAWVPPARSAGTTSTSRQPVISSQATVNEQVFEAVVARVWAGSLTAGDRITESSMARSLRTTRNQTRDALRTLASMGLLDFHPARGVLVPTPSREDVDDIYAARRALGTAILTRAISNPSLNARPIETALGELVRTARTGDSYATGNADLRFQDAIATHSGMRNIPQMFGTLAMQLRIYIAVMGITYNYPIDEMVADDTELFERLRARDLEGALRAWNRKIDATLQFMTSHVSRYR